MLSYLRRVIGPKELSMIIIAEFWFQEQQQQAPQQALQQQVGVGDEGLQLTRDFNNEIYLP